MTKITLDWIANALSRFDILDLQVTLSDMKDITLTDEQRTEQAYFDTYSQRVSDGGLNPYTGDDTPLGKTVL